jgi:hypothetical protein
MTDIYQIALGFVPSGIEREMVVTIQESHVTIAFPDFPKAWLGPCSMAIYANHPFHQCLIIENGNGIQRVDNNTDRPLCERLLEGLENAFQDLLKMLVENGYVEDTAQQTRRKKIAKFDKKFDKLLDEWIQILSHIPSTIERERMDAKFTNANNDHLLMLHEDYRDPLSSKRFQFWDKEISKQQKRINVHNIVTNNIYKAHNKMTDTINKAHIERDATIVNIINAYRCYTDVA